MLNISSGLFHRADTTVYINKYKILTQWPTFKAAGVLQSRKRVGLTKARDEINSELISHVMRQLLETFKRSADGQLPNALQAVPVLDCGGA